MTELLQIRPPTKKGRGIWIFMAGFLALIFLTLEIGARVYLTRFMEKSVEHKYQFDSYRVYAHKPGFREGKDGKDWIVINQQGFRRTTDVEKKKPANVFRAFFLGASAAHGISSNRPYPVRHIYPDETVDAHLEKMLQEKYPGKKIEIINAAVAGYHVFLHTHYLLSELLSYDPDLVIFFDGYADHFADNPDYDSDADFSYQFWRDKLQRPSLRGFFDYFVLWMGKTSAFARAYYALELQRDASRTKGLRPISKTWPNAQELIKAHRQAAQKQFLRYVRVNLLLLREFGIDAIVCFQPAFSLRSDELLSDEEKSWKEKWGLEDGVKEVLYPVIIEELKEVTDKFGASFIDMVAVFDDPKFSGQQLFTDYAHLSPEGGRAAAQALRPFVEKSLHGKNGASL